MHFSKLAATAIAAFFSAQALAAPTVHAGIAATLATEATDESQFWSLPALSDEEAKAILQSANPAINIMAVGADMCGQSSFFAGTGTPAYYDDCLRLAVALSQKSSTSWGVPTSTGWHKISSYSSCQFGIRNDSVRPINFIGAADIIDVIMDSLKNFAKYYGGTSTLTATISTKGRMRCYTGQELIWGLTSAL